MISKKVIGAGTLAGVGLLCSPTYAASVTFNLTKFTDQADSTSIVSQGITLTASDFNTGKGAGVDINGLCIAGSKDSGFCGNGDFVEYNNFSLVFSESVKLISYVPGFVLTEASSFKTVFSQGIDKMSMETDFVLGKSTNFSNQFNVDANQSVDVLSMLINDSETKNLGGILQFSELTVETIDSTGTAPEEVPEPVTILGTLLAGSLGLTMKRKKTINS